MLLSTISDGVGSIDRFANILLFLFLSLIFIFINKPSITTSRLRHFHDGKCVHDAKKNRCRYGHCRAICWATRYLKKNLFFCLQETKQSISIPRWRSIDNSRGKEKKKKKKTADIRRQPRSFALENRLTLSSARRQDFLIFQLGRYRVFFFYRVSVGSPTRTPSGQPNVPHW